MTNRYTRKALLTATVAAGACLMVNAVAVAPAVAQNSGASAADLVRQGDFWRARGRADLADQAYNRALQLDPSNAGARRGLAGGASVPAAPQAAPRPSPTQPAARPAAPARSGVSVADRAGRMRVAGFAALDSGQLRTAATHFEQALAINSRDADALGGLGLVRLRQERFKDAADLLDRASRGGSAARWAEALASARFFAGLQDVQDRTEAGDAGSAQTQLQALLQSASDAEQKTLVAIQLGDLMMDQGRYADALSAYGAGSSEDAQIIYKSALAEAGLADAEGDPMRAENAFRRAIQSGGATDPWVRYAFAGFLLEQGRRSDGAAIIQPLESSNNPEALYAVALYYSQADRAADAGRVLARVPQASRTPQMQALESEIRFVDAERQAKALASAGRISEAVELLARYDTAGASLGQQLRLAGTYQSLGFADRAAALARNAAQKPGITVAQQEPLVRLLAQTDQDELALEVIQRASGGNPSSPSAARLYSTLSVASADRLREQGHHAEAFDVLQSGWHLAPQDSAILVSLGRLYLAGDMNEEAGQVFNLALQRDSNNIDALTGLADTYAATRQFRKARDTYRQMLRLRPNDVEVYLAASRIEQAAGDRRAARRLLEQAQQLGAPQGLPDGTAFTVNNPFRTGPQRLAPVALNPFAPDTLRASSRADLAYAAPSPVQQALSDLDQEAAPRLDADIEARMRSGEGGLSNLTTLTAVIKGSVPVASGRAGIGVAPTVIDAGDPNRSARARFGRNGTAEALAIVAQQPTVMPAVESQYAAGVALSVFYEDENFQIDVGTTPLGFEETDVQGGMNWRARLGSNGSVRVFAERRPVTDSVLSYAGAVDPVSGQTWGAVMRTGGGLGLSWERDGTGIYGDVAYRVYAGHGVADNNAIEMNFGGYRRIYSSDDLTATAGLSLNYQAFDENLGYFTVGHGGYFSPQNFVSLAFPVNVNWNSGDWRVNASLTPGFQTYKQDTAWLYPLDPTAQGQLDALKIENNDVRSYYDGESRSGFAFSGGLEAWRMLGSTSIGGEARMNTFGNYDEYRMTLRLKQAFGSSY